MNVKIDQLLQNDLYLGCTDWFGNNFVHFLGPSFSDVLFLKMTRAGDNPRHLLRLLHQILINLCAGFVAVHDGHATIHQDQAVLRITSKVSQLDSFDSLFSVIGRINDFF